MMDISIYSIRKEIIMSVQYYNNAKGYGVICLDRPNKHNAISQRMAREFSHCLKIAKDDDIKFLVITGSGDKMFCAGGDLQELHGELLPDQAFAYLYPMKEVLYDILTFPVPTICLLNGSALGGGCEIATACDIRIAKEASYFGFVQTKLGIIPGWGGGVLLYEKVPASFAYQWLMEAECYDALYLHKRGWIQRIALSKDYCDHDKLLQPYLAKSKEQMHILKDQYKKKLSVLSLSAEMNEEVRNCAKLWDSEAHKEAVRHFLKQK